MPAKSNPNQFRYVTGIPRKPLPKGTVLVHNHVNPKPRLGMNGFRAWTQKLEDHLVQCDCAWAGVDLRGLVHYRVDGDKWLLKQAQQAK